MPFLSCNCRVLLRYDLSIWMLIRYHQGHFFVVYFKCLREREGERVFVKYVSLRLKLFNCGIVFKYILHNVTEVQTLAYQEYHSVPPSSSSDSFMPGDKCLVSRFQSINA